MKDYYKGMMKEYNPFFIKKKYITLSLFLERSEIGRTCEREPETKDADTDWRKYCYIELFLIHVEIPYSELYVFASLTKVSQPGSPRGPLSPCHL